MGGEVENGEGGGGGGVERQEVKLVMLMTIAKRAKAEQANDRARVGNVNRQERRDKWVGRSPGGTGHSTLNKRQTAKSAIFMLMNIIFLCLLSLLRKVSQINSLKWHFSILMMSSSSLQASLSLQLSGNSPQPFVEG